LHLVVIRMKLKFALIVLLCLAVYPASAQFGSGGSPCGVGDINSSCQVINQHLTSPLPASAGGTGTTVGHSVGSTRVLCSIRGANFNTTTDQACPIAASVTAWVPTSILATNCSGSFTLAVGGVYPATSKGGTALVAASQAYTALSGATVVLGLTLAANIATTRQTINTVYLSLTTGAGSAATCDFYVIGNDLT
jgi:hypothetical protein